MGRELKCRATIDGEPSQGTALLETTEIIFRGKRRIRIPLRGAKASVSGGNLTVKFSGGVAVLELGSAAEDWLRRILNPKCRAEKLGIKENLRIGILNLEDDEFIQEVRQRCPDLSLGKAQKDSDLIFLGVADDRELKKVGALVPYLKRNGALWIIRPKGVKTVTEQSVMAAGKAAGLVDVKVVSYSETHTAEKFVIPLAMRG